MPRPEIPPTPAASADLVGKEAQFTVGDTTATSINLPSPALQPCAYDHVFVKPPEEAADGTIAIEKSSSRAPANDHARTTVQSRPKRASADSRTKPSISGARRCARKTAHSVIERRRRCKMNEQFATLKNMIPGCSDQDMHKSAILEASICHLRQIEASLAELKVSNSAMLNMLRNHEAMDTQVLVHSQQASLDQSSVCARKQYQDEETSSSAISELGCSGAVSPGGPLSCDQILQQERKLTTKEDSYQISTSSSSARTMLTDKEQDQEATAVLLTLHQDRRHDRFEKTKLERRAQQDVARMTARQNGRRGMSVGDLLAH